MKTTNLQVKSARRRNMKEKKKKNYIKHILIKVLNNNQEKP